jgi:hypothetical protein
MTEQEQFQQLIAHNLARLSDLAAEWTGRLSAADRDWITVTALNIAWQRRHLYDPRRVSIVRWFEACVQSAVDQRPRWRVHTCNGIEWVESKHLRRQA